MSKAIPGERVSRAKPRKPLARKSALKQAAGRCPKCDSRSAGGAMCGSCALGDGPPLTMSTLKRSAPPKRKASTRAKRPGGAGAAGRWRDACLERNIAEYGVATCEATGLHLLPDWSCHHVIEVSSLNAMGLGGSEFVVWHPDNGMCLNRKPHMDHHNWSPRMTADRLKPWHWEFAELLDNTQGTEWATEYLKGAYR